MAEAQTSTPVSEPDGSLARRAGYTVGVVVNSALLYVINVWPGWESAAFVTPDAAQLLPLLNTALVAGVIANLIYLVFDRKWLKALGDLVTVGISLALLVSIWQVFPFVFDDSSVDWALILRVVLGVSIAGCVIALLVQLLVLISEVFRMRPGEGNVGAQR